jgi:cellobiose phosphorylase
VYTFHDDDRAVAIHRFDAPNPWINYLSNGAFHAFVSQAGGGFAWHRSPVTRRLTRYRQYHLPIDSPGFYIYIRQPDGTVWSPTFRPAETPLDSWSATHQPGRTVFRAAKGDLAAQLTLFVAPDHDALIWDLTLSNHGRAETRLDLFAYVEVSQIDWLGEPSWGYYCRHHTEARFLKDQGALLAFMRYQHAPMLYLAGSSAVAGYDGDRSAFIGDYRSERNPIVLEQGGCTNSELPCGDPCAAIANQLTLKPDTTRRLHYYLGVVRTAGEPYDQAINDLDKELSALRRPEAIDQQFAKLTDWWADHLDVYQCDIPDNDAQRQINIWSPVNSVHTGRYSRSVNTWAPGIRGIGFRDTCQDMLAIAYRKPDWAARSLHFLLTQQYTDGHVVHYCYPEEGKAPTTSVHSDDHLWPPLVARAIAAESGDLAFLHAELPFLADDHTSAVGNASAWEHLLEGIRFTENHLGKHRLPLTLHSDWNDIIGKFNRRGEGESVFAGQQYLVALNCLIELAEALGDQASLDWLNDCRQRMTSALGESAWDGQWWRRGFDDDGHAVGSQTSEFGKVFLNPQSWAVLAGLGSEPQQRQGMQAVSDKLDTDVGLKILDPGFKAWPDVDQPFSDYGPGTGENGAIFCHANTWAIMAEALLGNGRRAWKYFTQLIPHNVIRKVGLERYRAEPYAWVSNIVGPENAKFGWANVEQVTGTATWMDVAATQYLLGIRPEITGLRIDPCLPEDWQSFSVNRRYRGRHLNITVDNRAAVNKGVAELMIDGAPVDLSAGPVLSADQLPERGAEADIKLIMG